MKPLSLLEQLYRERRAAAGPVIVKLPPPPPKPRASKIPRLCLRIAKVRDPATDRRYGAANPSAVLDPGKVAEARTLYRSGLSLEKVAKHFGVGKRTIYMLLAGRTWAQVPDPLGPIAFRQGGGLHADAKLTWDLARAIRAEAATLPQVGRRKLLEKKYGVAGCTINKLLRGDSWKEEVPT